MPLCNYTLLSSLFCRYILNYNIPLKRINKQVNQEKSNKLAKCKHWKLVLYQQEKKHVLSLWLCPTNSVKHGIKKNENLRWKWQISDLAVELNMVNATLFKLKRFVDGKPLKEMINHARF